MPVHNSAQKLDRDVIWRLRTARSGAARRNPILSAEEMIKLAVDTHGDKLLLGWSGGKCSTVVLHMTLKIKPDIRAIFNNTGVEFPETVKYVQKIKEEWGVDLIVSHPEHNFWRIVEDEGHFPFTRTKNTREPKCCKLLKHKPTIKAIKALGATGLLDGIRAVEARMRAISISKWGQYHLTKSWANVVKYHPIAFWPDEQMNAYAQYHDIPLNPLYKEIPRSGCWPCTGFKSWRERLERTRPKMFKTIMDFSERKQVHFYEDTQVNPPCR